METKENFRNFFFSFALAFKGTQKPKLFQLWNISLFVEKRKKRNMYSFQRKKLSGDNSHEFYKNRPNNFSRF